MDYIEKTKKLLNNYMLIVARRNAINKLIKIKDDGVNGIAYDNVRIQNSNINKCVETLVINNIENEQQLNKELQVINNCIELFHIAFDVLDDSEKELIRSKYFEKLTNVQTATKLCVNGGAYGIFHRNTIKKIAGVIFGLDKVMQEDEENNLFKIMQK